MAGIPGVAGRIIARQRRAALSLDDLRAALVALGVEVNPRWAVKRLEAEIAKFAPSDSVSVTEPEA
jgi:hypothetical protein